MVVEAAPEVPTACASCRSMASTRQRARGQRTGGSPRAVRRHLGGEGGGESGRKSLFGLPLGRKEVAPIASRRAQPFETPRYVPAEWHDVRGSHLRALSCALPQSANGRIRNRSLAIQHRAVRLASRRGGGEFERDGDLSKRCSRHLEGSGLGHGGVSSEASELTTPETGATKILTCKTAEGPGVRAVVPACHQREKVRWISALREPRTRSQSGCEFISI